MIKCKNPSFPNYQEMSWSLQLLGWLLWCESNSWPGNFCMPQVRLKKGKEKKEKKKKKCQTLHFIYIYIYIYILGPHPRHIEVPRLGADSELQMLATATWHQNCIFDLYYHSSLQRQILNPLSEARDQTYVLLDTSQVCYHWATTGTPELYFNINRTLL